VVGISLGGVTIVMILHINLYIVTFQDWQEIYYIIHLFLLIVKIMVW